MGFRSLGAIVGGLTFGAFSERIGRRRAIVTAALFAIPVIPLWAFSTNIVLLAVGAFLIQLCVQGAWGVIPVHLNELSPDAVRATFPAFTYQLGNLLSSGNATIQAGIAEGRGNNYALALAVVGGLAALTVAILTLLGRENHGIEFGAD